MYVVSNNIKILSLVLVVLGLLGIGYGFYSSPKTIEESKEMIASMGHDSHSHDSHSSLIDHGQLFMWLHFSFL